MIFQYSYLVANMLGTFSRGILILFIKQNVVIELYRLTGLTPLGTEIAVAFDPSQNKY